MRSILLLLMSLLPHLGHAAQPGAIAPGMSPQEVIAVLGAPDRIAVFAGKYLRDVPLAAAASAPEGKFVFVYRDKNFNVWFSHGKATGLGQDGGSNTNPSGSPGRR
jgi:hypothetical protein